MPGPPNSYFLDHISHCFTSQEPLMRALAYDCVGDLVKALTPEAKIQVKKEWEAYYNYHPEYSALVLKNGPTPRLEASYRKLETGIDHETPRMAKRVKYLNTHRPSLKLYNDAK